MQTYTPERTWHQAFCELPFTKLIVNAWGDVCMCCHHPGNYQLGNIRNYKDLIDIWNLPVAKEIREVTLQGRFHQHCAAAPDCPIQFREKTPYNFLAYKDFKHPTHLEVDLPDKHCNIGGEDPTTGTPACIMCIRRHRFPKDQEDITDMICEKSKSLMPYLTKFSVLGVAEPFWKDALFNIFEKVNFSRYKENIEFDTNHNVTCFGDKTQNRFLKEVQYSSLQFSIDAATPETYKKIRVLDAYDLIISNLKLWMTKRTFPHHKVTIWNNINMLNVYEMTRMVEVASELRVDRILMLPTHSQNGKINIGNLMLGPNNYHIFKNESDKAAARARELGIVLELPVPFDAPKNLVQLGV